MIFAGFSSANRWQRTAQLGFVVLAVVILVLSLLPIEHPQISPNDKLNHLLAYGMLAALGGFGYRIGFAGSVAFLWGVLIEELQGLTGYRLFSVADIVANGIGVGLGLGLVWLFNLWRHRKSPASKV